MSAKVPNPPPQAVPPLPGSMTPPPPPSPFRMGVGPEGAAKAQMWLSLSRLFDAGCELLQAAKVKLETDPFTGERP